MKRSLISIIFICLIALNQTMASTITQDQTKKIRTLINLLDYIGTDYHNAVKKGNVKNRNEYAEMNEFVDKSVGLYNEISKEITISNNATIGNDLSKLKSLILKKASFELVLALSGQIKQEILKQNLIQISPDQWPDILNGKKLFAVNCVSCHGVKGAGNGVLAKTLNPKPANLLNDTTMSAISPFQIYNTARLGISGTSMPAFDMLTDKEVWDLAFYVNSLRYSNRLSITDDSLNSLVDKVSEKISLEDVATLPDNKLIKKNGLDIKTDSLYLAAIRLYKGAAIKNISISIASKYLDDVLEFYRMGELDKAGDKALFAYLDGIEPYEGQLNAINSDLKNQLESSLYRLREDIKSRKPISVINADISRAKNLINNAAVELSNQNFTFWFAFLFAASIILREGIEAFLIIITILGVLKSVNAKKAVSWIHGGWVTALIIGIASMFFINIVVSLGSQNRELMEGLGSLIAVILLLYIGFWLHSKTEIKKWKEFVENKILRLVNGKNMFGLFFISFIVVFREAFESAIFLSAVNLEVEQGSKSGLYIGAASSLIVVLVLAWLAIKFTAKLPIRKLFKYSALTMAVLAIVLVGKGMHALQESGYSSITHISLPIKASLLGVYPTIETFIAQLIVTIFTIILWNYSKKMSRPN